MRLLLAIFLLWGAAAQAQPSDWRIVCGADANAITRDGTDWVLRPSRDHCSRSDAGQRSEISTRPIPATTRQTLAFSARVTLRASRYEAFDIFRVYDGGSGCTPPLKVQVTESGRIRFVSGRVTADRGCTIVDMTPELSQGFLRRDGTEQSLDIVVDFDGHGGFEAILLLDGRKELSGAYVPGDLEPDRDAVFLLRHGVFAQTAFDFEMITRDLSLREVVLR